MFLLDESSFIFTCGGHYIPPYVLCPNRDVVLAQRASFAKMSANDVCMECLARLGCHGSPHPFTKSKFCHLRISNERAITSQGNNTSFTCMCVRCGEEERERWTDVLIFSLTRRPMANAQTHGLFISADSKKLSKRGNIECSGDPYHTGMPGLKVMI